MHHQFTKKKDDPLQPEKKLPITYLGCFGKLFNAVLNLRLNNFIEHEVFKENRVGYSTNDNIFVFNAIIKLLKVEKLKLFCSFVIFSKAFDSVWRVGLWSKLLKNNINGKFFRLVFNIDQGIKSCISFNGTQSSFFHCLLGV